ncbi:FMN-dependent NADH-azoreductase [Rheinheimera nanhaiensis]|uniref:FMN dependent NADH:quinone oxidoreductase n=1 Tax=Rheinheimera nanhaiensis E407-8 TaxID=562729 RepID=I1E1Z7_9GAMM|nr:NAD(P)H-dependent oxidoreductase [Rheinheimera nanhaiensis]GAB60325.1 FMN-dependent NADH-azoreductase [Rheinheimera nanhaiensis E407-8]
MKQILLINSSINGDKGHSVQLAQQFLAQLPKGSFTLDTLDLNTDPVGHLEMAEIAAWMTPTEQRSSEQQQLAAISDQLIARIKAADVIVLGVPMYNFGVPSQLKALLDRVARAGVTFKYTEQGPVGLLDDKPVVVFATRGGVYQGTALDSQTPFLHTFLNFVGLKDVHFIYAEGLNMGADAQQAALTAAKARLAELSAKIAA